MKFELEAYNRNTPDEDLLSDLKKVANELGKETITIDKYNERGKYHSTTLTRRFGGWNKSLEKAALKITKSNNTTVEDFFKNIEEVWLKLGRQPRYSEMKSPMLNLMIEKKMRSLPVI